MSTAPTSVVGLVLPADGTESYCKKVGTVKEEILPRFGPLRTTKFIERDARALAADAIFMSGKCSYQPDISLLPNIKEHWPGEAWDKRAVARPSSNHHLFYTQHKENLQTNPHLQDIMSGDAIILKVSDEKDKDGLRFYVDITDTSTDLEKLVSKIPRRNWKIARFFGKIGGACNLPALQEFAKVALALE